MNIHYNFKNKKLLETALTHVSYANDHNVESNQRLEFLGDSILSFIIAEYIYTNYPNMPEGKLTEFRSLIVCESSLAEAAARLSLGNMLKIGGAESGTDGRKKPSILADTFEAVLGAIFLDSDIQTATDWVIRLLNETIEKSAALDTQNYKSALQTFFQKRDKSVNVVVYSLRSKSGPDHAPVFTVDALYNGKVIGSGSGKNRKTAEQKAAKHAFNRLNLSSDN